MGKKTIGYYFFGGIDKISRKFIPRYKRREVILFRYTNALGDALMLTTLAREVRKRNPSAYIKVVTGFPDIFNRNPDINEVIHEKSANINNLGRYLMRYEHRFPWKTHLLNYCKECVDISDSIDLKTYIYPAKDDFEFAEKIINTFDKPVILINRTAGPRTDKKNWPDEYWIHLISKMVSEYALIEVGSILNDNNNFKSNNYLNLCGETTIHQTAALMSRADLLLCPVTGLLHLASAFNLKTLCILGGSEPESGTKYSYTHFLTDRPQCADCYEKGPCTNDFLCLKNIKTESVYIEVKNLLSQLD